ncbi:hypothetical protein K8T06_06385 [bacterium]|nr:hypothetical protein [bacterium]
MRCSDAGAGSAVMINRTDETQLMDAIKAARVDYEIVFLEKNSRLESLAPDLYLFMETNVKSVRDDCKKLRCCADIILQYPVVDDDKFCEVIQRIRELRQCSHENYSRG